MRLRAGPAGAVRALGALPGGGGWGAERSGAWLQRARGSGFPGATVWVEAGRRACGPAGRGMGWSRSRCRAMLSERSREGPEPVM